MWFCAHIPSFLEHAYPHPQLPPNVSASSIFWEEAAKVAGVGEQWARAEQEGTAMRAAHRMIEWDGWEDGLVNGILGEIDNEEDVEGSTDAQDGSVISPIVNGNSNAAKFGTFVGVGTSTVPLRLLGPVQSPVPTNEEVKELWQREGFEERLVQQMRENFLSHTAIAYLRHPHSSSKLTKLKLPIPNGAVVVPGAKNIKSPGRAAIQAKAGPADVTATTGCSPWPSFCSRLGLFRSLA